MFTTVSLFYFRYSLLLLSEKWDGLIMSKKESNKEGKKFCEQLSDQNSTLYKLLYEIEKSINIPSKKNKKSK